MDEKAGDSRKASKSFFCNPTSMAEKDAIISEILGSLGGEDDKGDFSRATSPGCGRFIRDQGPSSRRWRPRTFPYRKYLPYKTETEEETDKNLDEILRYLYIAIEAGDLSKGAIYWTRELKNWLGLKFDITVDVRVKLVRLYYELALAPGVDPSAADRFAGVFMLLTKRKHYLRPGVDLYLDWRPLYRQLKPLVLPSESAPGMNSAARKNPRTMVKICSFAQQYFDPAETDAMLEEMLPFFSTSFAETGFVVVGFLNLFLPTIPPRPGSNGRSFQDLVPTYFHIWSLINRSSIVDGAFLDLFSRFARDGLGAEHTQYSPYGIFTQEQSSHIFTAILRLLETPVGPSTSAYSVSVDLAVGLGLLLQRDTKKHPIAHLIARWIIMSLTPACLAAEDSILANLEGLIQAVETFFHPSNQGAWTKPLAQLVYYLADFFVMRWNREKSGEMDVPAERRLNDSLKTRFVLCLKDVVFMSIYAKSGTAMSFALSTLESLAYLAPELILPRALQQIYPSLQGLVEVHRTTSSLKALKVLTSIISRTKGYRCHITTLLGLAIPGIDANDLDKTLLTLNFIQGVCYNVPLQDLTHDNEGQRGTMLAMEWVTSQVNLMEQEGPTVDLKYHDGLSDEDEEAILRSSTADLKDFLSAFLGKVFTLLENLPDSTKIRSGSPEENIVNTLPATFTPLLAGLSADLYDIALNKISEFISKHVVHQARDAMAFIVSTLCKAQPEKALKRLIPMLVQSIRTELDENGAASTRTAGSEILPRDRALVWNISMLAMTVVHVGDAVLSHKQDLLDIAAYMQVKCIGVPTMHVANFVHHLLLALTEIYHVDNSLYDEHVIQRGVSPSDWGKVPDPKNITIKWHVPNRQEIKFACDLFKNQGSAASQQITELLDSARSSPKDAKIKGKEWSDELSKNLILLRLLISGIAVLFDRKAVSSERYGREPLRMNGDIYMANAEDEKAGHEGHPSEHEELDITEDTEENEVKPTFSYPVGYALEEGDPTYREIHDLRREVGALLHRVHEFLFISREDDVQCFSSLYSALKVWFIDVGTERTAHGLDRITRLYASDIQPYKLTGLRKEYPRPLLVRRAGVYHLQRLRHNSTPRPMTSLDEQLMFDLVESSTSSYVEVRRLAQSAGESAFKALIGSRTIVLPRLVEAFETGIKDLDFHKIKGALFCLLFNSLSKTIARQWRLAPRVIRSWLAAGEVDRPSVSKICSSAMLTIMDIGRSSSTLAIFDNAPLENLAPADDVQPEIEKKKTRIEKLREFSENRKAELAEELVGKAKGMHWKLANRAIAVITSLSLRFATIAPDSVADFLAEGAVDPHPGLRALYSGAFSALLNVVDARCISGHDRENYVLGKEVITTKVPVEARMEDSEWTEQFLGAFRQPSAEFYVDDDHPGWLVWSKKFTAYQLEPNLDPNYIYDDTETNVLKRVGSILDRAWFSAYFKFLKEEPRDQNHDRFRVSNAVAVSNCFEIMLDDLTTAKLKDIKELILDVFGDGGDKNQHRATAELLGALVTAVTDKSIDLRTDVWNFTWSAIKVVFQDGLTPENFSYWTTFVHMLLQGKDPRRSWPLVEYLGSFRLDMGTNAAFKESSKLQLLQQCITSLGWHFRDEKPLLEDFLAHLDHPYKGVREAIGQTLAAIYRYQNHESYKDVSSLVSAQKAASSTGMPAYRPTDEFTNTMNSVFSQIESWRLEHQPNQQAPSSYTMGSKTVLIWLDNALTSYECTSLTSFFPDLLTPALLHMMDIREDQELQSLAYHVFRHLPNVPHSNSEDAPFIEALIKIGKTSAFWHQRLRVMVNIQVFYFRRLFLLSSHQQQLLYDCIASMLEDSQLEVRLGAASTLSGMIRCSPSPLRDSVIEKLNRKFTMLLLDNPLPKKTKNRMDNMRSIATNGESTPSSTASPAREGAGTPTPEHNRLILTRHAAVLGLGALVQAFPYTSPPPAWVPSILALLANKASGDPGVVGKGAKSILSDFKKLRSDTWFLDSKVRYIHTCNTYMQKKQKKTSSPVALFPLPTLQKSIG